MTVTDKNCNEYLKLIQHCKYQVTFPSMSSDTLYVVCTYGVDTEKCPPQACKECIGVGCKCCCSS